MLCSTYHFVFDVCSPTQSHVVGGISFSLPSYIFIENERMGTVRVNGPAIFPAPLSVQITGG